MSATAALSLVIGAGAAIGAKKKEIMAAAERDNPQDQTARQTPIQRMMGVPAQESADSGAGDERPSIFARMMNPSAPAQAGSSTAPDAAPGDAARAQRARRGDAVASSDRSTLLTGPQGLGNVGGSNQKRATLLGY